MRSAALVELGALADDDAVLVLDGTSLAPRALASTPAIADGDFAVYDLTVSPHRNYFAGGVLVHNY